MQQLTNDMISNKALIRAADWWFDRFIGPDQFKDNGSNDVSSLLAGALGGLTASYHPVEESQRQPFREAIIRVVREKVETSPYPVYLNVDYRPSPLLAEAMASAGIDDSRAPIKTDMFIGNHDTGKGVLVCAGYAAHEVFMWDLQGETPTTRKKVEYTRVYPARTYGDKHWPEKRLDNTTEMYDTQAYEDFVSGCRTPTDAVETPDSYRILNHHYTETKNATTGEWEMDTNVKKTTL